MPNTPNTVAAFVCATALWVMFAVAASYDLVKSPAGEPWVVTERMPSRLSLVRAQVPFQTATAAQK